MTDIKYTLSLTKAAERRIRRMLLWRFWIRKPVVMLSDILPPGTMVGRTKQEIQQEIYEYYHCGRWTTENLALRITSIDGYDAEDREIFLMNVGHITLAPHHIMRISGRKDWILDFVNNKFVLEEFGGTGNSGIHT
jgi:hypothetical protein